MLSFIAGSSMYITSMIIMGIHEPSKVLDASAIIEISSKSSCIAGFMASITYFVRWLMTKTFIL
jgi:hypothetical protein